MKQLIVDNQLWELLPEVQLFVLEVQNLDNKVTDEREAIMNDLLEQAAEEGKRFVPNEPISQNQVVAEWRDAFKMFKTKKGARSSIESLLKRVQKGNTVRSINPLVDIYNIASMKYGVPVGSEDTQKIVGDMHLGIAEGGEAFFPLGADKSAPALEGEVCYYDEEGAVCRCFNWREAERTMITENTTEAVVIIEALNDDQAQRAREAQLTIKQLLKEYLKADVTETIITKESPSAPIQK